MGPSESMSCEALISDEERKSLRASASPFYPDKNTGKLGQFTIRTSLANLRENGSLLSGLTTLIDKLSKEE